MLVLASLAPIPTQKVEEFVKIGSHTLVKMRYTNPTNQRLAFTIGSSRPEFVEPTAKMVEFAAT